MEWSRSFIPTLRDDPQDADAASHRLLLRAGFVRQLAAGVYSLLPLGWRVCRKIEAVLREEMEGIGAQEFRLPALHPAELWRRSGRWHAMGREMFRLRDRRDAELCLGMTHEEAFAQIASELRSYRELPQIWFQLQTKFRDEPRPKAGLLRVREFIMKDSYSLDVGPEGLDRAFDLHFNAYRRIFERCGLDAVAVEASSGAMGGSQSVEFMVASEAGEDFIAFCPRCGYAANLEKASAADPPRPDDAPGPAPPEAFPTPGVRTIADLEALPEGAPASRQIKTLVYRVGRDLALVLLRGDHSLAEAKLAEASGSGEPTAAAAAEIHATLGASAGSLGAVGVRDLRILADTSLRGRRNLVTGANREGFHLRGVDVARDIAVTDWCDLREVQAGDLCAQCDAPLEVKKTIEVGHIFKLGTRYSEAFGATVQDQAGVHVPIAFGSYGIGVGRVLAAIAESRHDERGLVWPVTAAPFEVAITVLHPGQTESAETGTHLYEALRSEGLDVILDLRDERPGVKFTDVELVGIPYLLVVGPRGLAEKKVELVRRRDGRRRELPVERAAATVAETIHEERR